MNSDNDSPAWQPPAAVSTPRQVNTGISIALATAIIGGWIASHVFSVFVFELTWETWAEAAGLLALNTWLSVGMFIVAHDCMHSSLMPGRPAINRAVGRLCLFLYAGLSFE
jgi:beta-carotene/zeaxanthin 4-ketolase